MSQHIVEAVFENGSFRPLDVRAVQVAEGQRVRLVVDDSALPPALQRAFEVYQGLSHQEIDEIEQIALDRSRFFTPRNGDS
jgi:predicted DNA-binding antitoxin AbrB/MazE fold protein